MAQQFPKWVNKAPKLALIVLFFGLVSAVFIFWFWFSPYNLNVGYKPDQPVPYSHKLHVGKLGMDCRYCHQFVEKSAYAGVPSTEVCMNCHKSIKTNSLALKEVKKSFETGDPIQWIRVHKVGDYAYFDHSVHSKAGVGCVQCHGRVDKMDNVQQRKPLSMGWCINCHRNPELSLSPIEKITDMDFKGDEKWIKLAKKKAKLLHPPVENCSGCHQ